MPQTRIISADGERCADGSHVYNTVTEALGASHPGDTLLVCPGNYPEDVTIQHPVRLESLAGPARTTLHRVTVTGDNARLAGFRLRALNIEGATEVELLGNVVIGSEIYLPVVLRRKG
jgi:nitrous oxidase accessory protein NosD